MQDRPTIPELLTAVTHLLDEEVVPNLSGSRQFYGRVAANVLRIVMRELEHGEEQSAAEWQRLDALLSPAEKPAKGDIVRDEIWKRTGELCARIQNGDADSGPYREQVLSHLRQTIHDKLVISNPKWITRPVEEE